MSVILKQFDGGAIAPRDDAILYNSIITRNGILDGCTITHLGANQLKITAGRGIIKGRMFEVEEMTVNCTLASSGTQRGRMYLRMELSNMENPAQIKTVAADTLPELVQEEDCNYTNGIYELELCTYDVTDTLLSNLKTTYEVIDTVFPVAKTLDDVNGVTDENVLAGALAVKELNSDIKFPDGVGFYPDIQEGVRGYNTDPARGADTFSPFRSELEWEYFYNGNSGTTTYTYAFDDLDTRKVYYFVLCPLMNPSTPSYVSSISEDGIYTDILTGTILKPKVIKVERATSVTFRTILGANNSGVNIFRCTV